MVQCVLWRSALIRARRDRRDGKRWAGGHDPAVTQQYLTGSSNPNKSGLRRICYLACWACHAEEWRELLFLRPDTLRRTAPSGCAWRCPDKRVGIWCPAPTCSTPAAPTPRSRPRGYPEARAACPVLGNPSRAQGRLEGG